MSCSSEPVPCPGCTAVAERRIVAPYLADMNPHNRIAHQHNEKSAHEPRVVRRNTSDASDAGHRHHHGHQHPHSGPHHHRPSRPWMIGH